MRTLLADFFSILLEVFAFPRAMKPTTVKEFFSFSQVGSIQMPPKILMRSTNSI